MEHLEVLEDLETPKERGNNESFEELLDVRSKTSLRIHYEAQVQVIKGQLGSLESIRVSLGLSQRKISQLLMVDPSSWTRWTRQGDEAPPHIWRALQWYFALNERLPGLTPQYFIGKDPQILHQKALQELESERKQRLQDVSDLHGLFEKNKNEKESLEKELQNIKKDLKFHKNLSIFVLSLTALLGCMLLFAK